MTPRLGSPKNIVLTAVCLWDLAVGVGAFRIYKNWKRRQG